MKNEKRRIAIVGTGWRSEFYVRIAKACPEMFELCGIWYHSEKGRASAVKAGVPLFDSMDDIAKLKPDYAVVSLPGSAMIDALVFLSERGIPCLAETFTLPDVQSMSDAYAKLKNAAVQVAEQYQFQPLNAARLMTAKSGVLGKIYHVRMSIPTRHHPASLVRMFLNTKDALPQISAQKFMHKALKGPGRAGDPKKEEWFDAFHEIVTYDFGDVQAVNDFEDMQHRSFMRNNYFLVRGERGEIVNEHVSYMKDFMTPVEYDLKRVTAGSGVDLQGMFLRGVSGAQEGWLYYNRFIPARLYDDELAVAECMYAMGEYIDEGKRFYGLNDALTDIYYAYLTEEAIKSGEKVHAQKQSWM